MTKDPTKIKDPEKRIAAIRKALMAIDLKTEAGSDEWNRLNAAEADAADELMSAEDCISHARIYDAQMDQSRVSRDKAIRQAASKGASTRQIAGQLGLTHAGVAKIINR